MERIASLILTPDRGTRIAMDRGSIDHAIVHCVFHWVNPKVDPNLTAHFDRVLWVCTALAWTIGPLLIYGILHYEWFGGDPQKRSLGNRYGVARNLHSCKKILLVICKEVIYMMITALRIEVSHV